MTPLQCETNLKYAGAYTFTSIDRDLSAEMEIYNPDTLSGYVINGLSFQSSPDDAFLASYLISGANVAFSYPLPTTHRINDGVILTNFLAAGSTVPFYIPFLSFRIAENSWLYYGVRVYSYSIVDGQYLFSKEVCCWEIDNRDANDATTRRTIRQFVQGATSNTFVFYAGYCRSLYFSTSLPSSETPNPPVDELCLRIAFFNQSGTVPATLTVSYSSNWQRNVILNNAIMFSFAKNYAKNHYWPQFTIPYHGDTSGPGGGNGSFSGASDTIALPGHPSMGVTSAGFIRVYNIGVGGLSSLGFELFPPLAYTPPSPLPATQDSAEALVNGFNAIVTFLANIPSFFDQIMANTLINYVIDCHVIPVNPGSGSSEAIHVGPKTLTTYADRIYTDYVDVSCGSINIEEFYASFADFITTAKLYLPFVGFVPVRPEWWQATTLSVDYKFNVIDGSFSCFVRSGGKYVNNGGGGTIVGQYGGVACMHIPITGVSYSSMVSGLIGAGSGMLAGAGSGNIAAAASSAIEAATSRGDIATSNSYSSSAAFLGCRVPFLMIERPVASYSANYQHEVGIPANVFAKLGDVPGFVKMENVHIDGVPGATEAEKNEIKRLLAQGVIV